jgi:GNAT superfamily N-acetyltransferase
VTVAADVEIRPMHRTDGGRLMRFHRRLSAETTRLRFFTFHPELSADELYRFTHVDHHDREAVVAVQGDEIIAVGRYDHDPGSADAEVAFVVEDAWQGTGVGRRLFDELALRARSEGIERLTAQTLAENRRMLMLFHHCGYPVRHRFDDGVIDVEIDLQAEPAHDTDGSERP